MQININFYWPVALSRIFKAIRRIFLLDALRSLRSQFSDRAGVRMAEQSEKQGFPHQEQWVVTQGKLTLRWH